MHGLCIGWNGECFRATPTLACYSTYGKTDHMSLDGCKGRKALEKQRTEHDRRTPRFLLGGCYLYAPYGELDCYLPSWQMFSVPPQLWNVEH